MALREAPYFGDLTGRDGLPYRVWRNPTRAEFSSAVRRAKTHDLAGLRGLFTADDLYVWQSTNLLHADFERQSGISGLRVAIRADEVQANDETVAQPEQFPWVFPDAAAAAEMDIEQRRNIVEAWLGANLRLKAIYPNGFKVIWYS